MKLKNGLIGFAAAMGLLLGACNSGGDSTSPVAAADLIGNWFYRSSETKGSIRSQFTVGGKTYDTTTVIDTSETYTGNEYYIEFKSDSSYTANSPDVGPEAEKSTAAADLETGTWSVSGSTLTTISSDKDTAKVNIAISGNTLNGTMAIDTTSAEGGFSMTTHVTVKISLAK